MRLAGITLLPLLVLAVALSSRAQGGGSVDYSGTGGMDAINGRIYYPSGQRSDTPLKVSLESSNGGTRILFVDRNGSFSFRNLEPGHYNVTVEGGEYYESATESVTIDDMRISSLPGLRPPPRSFSVSFELKPKRQASSGYGASVIDARLANVPDTARELYKKAQEAEKSGGTDKAIQQLKQAIAIYPAFFLALNELGIQYLKSGQPGLAADALSAAIKLAPQEYEPRLHFGIVLLNQRKYAEAETELRTAIKLNDSVPTAHMYLGIALAVQRKLSEGEKELLLSLKSKSPTTSLAHRYLGGIYVEKREFKRAADELELYLKLIPDAPDAERVRSTIKEYRNKS
jgi:Flp pilus assembly protein TadD